MIHTILNFVNKAGAASPVAPSESAETKKALKAITGLSKITDNLNISEQARTAMIFNAVSASAGAKIRVDSETHDPSKKKERIKEEPHKENESGEKHFRSGRDEQQSRAPAKKRDAGKPARPPGGKGNIIDILV